MPLRGIFFDLDETLVSYEPAENAAFVATAASMSGVSAAMLRRAVVEAYVEDYRWGQPGFARLATLPTRALREELTVAALERLGIDDNVAALVEAHEAACNAQMYVFPEVHEVLAALKPDFILGVITNGPGPMQREKLERFSLMPYFSVIGVDTEVGFTKPDKGIFEWAAAQAELKPEELLFVGNDPDSDIAGARNAGWKNARIFRDGSGVIETEEPVLTTLRELLLLPAVAEVRQAG
ncbi:MAG: HAD family hydrolase [Armatimonas sp.]